MTDRDRVRPDEGDIIVTAVGGRYAIGRLKADHDTQESLGSQEDRAKALQRACVLAGGKHQVFLYLSTGTSGYVQYVCPKVSK
jgi:hypothetical protein